MILKIFPVNRTKRKSKTQIMFQPKKILKIPATYFFSWKRVMIPQKNDVTGINARITLTILESPK